MPFFHRVVWQPRVLGVERRAVPNGLHPGNYTSHSTIRHRTFSTIALFAMLALAGCAEPTTGTVSGTVTVDGVPAKAGSIAFFPTNGKFGTAGGEIRDGRYTATVALGTSKVEVRVPKVIGQKKLYDTPNSPVQPLYAETLPAKYNEQTELTIDVKPGENTQDYPLTTK